MLLPLFRLSYTSIAIAPIPPAAANADKLISVNPIPWSLTPTNGLPTMPGSTAPSIQPTLNVNVSGSSLNTFVPSTGESGLVMFGSEYAVAAIRRSYVLTATFSPPCSGLALVWNRTFILVCMCRWLCWRSPCKAIVKGVHCPAASAPVFASSFSDAEIGQDGTRQVSGNVAVDKEFEEVVEFIRKGFYGAGLGSRGAIGEGEGLRSFGACWEGDVL